MRKIDKNTLCDVMNVGKCQRFESAYLHNTNKKQRTCLIQKYKGLWWIPWHLEAMKDVVTCDKPREVGNKL